LVKSVYSAFLWSTVGRIINAFTKFFSVPLMLTHYGKENYGLLALAFSVNVYMQIMDMGFNVGNVKFIASWIPKNKKEEINQLIQSSLSFYGVIGVLNFIFLLIVAYFSKSIFNLSYENDLVLKKLFYILAGSSIISWVFSISNQILKAYEKIDYDEKLTLVTNILIFILVLFTIKYNLSLTLYFLIHSILLLSMYPARLYKCKRLNSNINFKFKWHPKVFKEVIKYSATVFFLGIFQFSASNLRPIIIGIQSGISEVTDYRIILQITSLILIFTGSLMGILLPMTSKLDPVNDIEVTKKIVNEYTKIISLLISSLVFGLILISKPFIIIYIGEEFLNLRIWLILWALTFLGSHLTAISAIILAHKSLKPITYFTMFSSIASIAICWFLSPFYGVGGAVISLIIYTFLQLLFYYIYYIPVVMKFNSLEIFVYSFFIPALIGFISFVLIHYIFSSIIFDSEIAEIVTKALLFGLFFLLLTNFMSIRLNKVSKILNI
jgi:O-antigen/teichoic acid export membrane protein